MIKSFKCKETEKLFFGRFSAKLPQAIQRAAAMKLKILHAASIIETLPIPSTLPVKSSGIYSALYAKRMQCITNTRYVLAVLLAGFSVR